MSTTTNYEVPLTNEPQTFEIALGGKDYQITNKWNDSDDSGWVLDIADSEGNPIACNIPLITGGDCLAGLEYLELGGSLIVNTNGSNPYNVPTLDNLGVDSILYFQVVS